MPAWKESLSRGWDTTWFLAGVILVLLLPLYLAVWGLREVGLPTPAEIAGGSSQG